MQFVWENFYNKEKVKLREIKVGICYIIHAMFLNVFSYQDFCPLLQHFKLWTSLLAVEAAEPRV